MRYIARRDVKAGIPVSPVKPVAPVNPVKPVAPVKPVSPVKPVNPVAPVAPEEQTGKFRNYKSDGFTFANNCTERNF